MEILKKYGFILFIALLGCDSPESPDCFKSRGEDAVEVRVLTSFNAIEVLDYIEVEIEMDSERFIEIRGGENLLPKISTRVQNGILHLENDNTCNFVRSFNQQISVTVHTPELQSIVLRDGSGPVKSFGTLTGDSLFLETNHSSGDIQLDLDYRIAICLFPTGTSDVILRGNAEQLELFSDSFGMIDARQLNAGKALVNNSSINDFYIWPQEYFYAAINGSGNIFVKGEGVANDISDNGSGSVLYIE